MTDVTIEIGNLATRTEAIVGPAGSQVLIGQVVLETLDLVADCRLYESRVRAAVADARSRFDTVTNETKIILGSTIGTVLTTAIGLAVLITTLFVNLGSRIEALREDMREDYQRLDDRMRTVEQGFAKIDQRLATLERAVIPAAEPAE